MTILRQLYTGCPERFELLQNIMLIYATEHTTYHLGTKFYISMCTY